MAFRVPALGKELTQPMLRFPDIPVEYEARYVASLAFLLLCLITLIILRRASRRLVDRSSSRELYHSYVIVWFKTASRSAGDARALIRQLDNSAEADSTQNAPGPPSEYGPAKQRGQRR